MNIEVRSSFERDVARIRGDAPLKARIRAKINEIEAANSPSSISGIERVQSARGSYRVRIRSYRMGVFIRGDTMILVRFLHRRDIYRNFP